MNATVDSAQSLPGLLLGLAVADPARGMFVAWRDKAWKRMPRGDFAQAVADAARGLRVQGVMPGDRVLLVSENRPEFIIADTAIMATVAEVSDADTECEAARLQGGHECGGCYGQCDVHRCSGPWLRGCAYGADV